MGFTYVPIVGSYQDSVDVPATGSVTFVPTVSMDNNETISTAPVVVELVNGQIPDGFDLAATNDPGTTPTGAAYHVIEIVNGAVRKYVIQVSYTAQKIDLSTVEKGSVAPDTYYTAAWGP